MSARTCSGVGSLPVDFHSNHGHPQDFPTFSGHTFIRTNLSLPAFRGQIYYALNCAATKAARIAETPISRCWALRANFRNADEFLASLKVIRHASQPVSTLRSGPTADKIIRVQKTPSKGGSNVF